MGYMVIALTGPVLLGLVLAFTVWRERVAASARLQAHGDRGARDLREQLQREQVCHGQLRHGQVRNGQPSARG